MLILTSNGLSSSKLLDMTGEYIKSGKAALVVTADNEYKEKNYHVDRLTKELQSLRLSVECFDFNKQSPDELQKYDVIELIGGNPYYLLQSIRENQFLDILSFFAENRCVIGCSAGALVLTPSLDLIDLYSPEMNFFGLKDLTACHFTDIQILPHYKKFLKRYERFEEKCVEFETENNCTVIRLNDGEGIIIEHKNVQMIK